MGQSRNRLFDGVFSLPAFLFIILSTHFSWALDQTFLTDATIAAADHTYDGYSIIVGDGSNPVTLTINGAHSFASMTVKKNAIVTHSATDVSNVYFLDLTVSGNVDIESGGSINADGRGYLGGYQGGNSNTYGRSRGNQNATGSGGGTGGSHGGYGGWGSGGALGIAYDDVADPREPGAGGGSDSGGHHGGNGGGLIRMAVGGILTNDGVISANGMSPGYYVSGGGAGGAIYLDAGAFAGSGTITANGGAAGTYSGIPTGGGGGGRIAIYCGTNTFSGVITSYGAAGHDGGGGSGAGTIFRKQTIQAYGDVEVNNNISTPDISTPTPFEVWRGISDASGGITTSVLTDGTASWTPGEFVGFMLNPNLNQNIVFPIIANTETTITVSGDMTVAASDGNSYAVARCQFDTLTISGTAYAGIVDFGFGLAATDLVVGDGANQAILSMSGAHTFESLLVKDNSVVTHPATDLSNVCLLNLTISGNVDIESGGSINADGRGYLGGYRGGNNTTYGRTRGNQNTVGSSGGTGGSHGGYGGWGTGGVLGIAYDDVADPREPGAGGGADSGGHPGGNGGGLIRITVGGILTNDGVISANGMSPGYYVSGGGAGGAIYLDAGAFAGSGSITANGGAAGTYSGIPTGGGGGGRIAIYYGTNTFSGVITSYGAAGHDGGGSSGAGTIFRKQTIQAYGDVEVNNNISTPDISTPTPFEVWRGVSDASGGITASVLTDGTASWTPGKFVGFMLNPNLAQNATFVIIANTATTITVSGDMTGAAVSGNAYAVARCQFDTMTISGTAYAGITDFGFGLTACVVTVGDGTNQAILSLSGAHSFASLLVKNNAVVTHPATDISNVFLLNLTVSGNVDIESGGSINADGRGYLGGYQGANNSTYGRTRGNQNAVGSGGGTGGSHGGYGGWGSGGALGIAYDDVADPREPGAGGGSDSGGHHGGNGGGLIRITVGGILTNDGVISANGMSPGYYVSGGGAGGAIYLDAGAFAGSGSITANGGAAGTYSGIPTGGGGGGRIAIYCGTNTFSGVITSYGAAGHDGGGSSGAGTIFRKQTIQAYGDVEVNNNISTPDISTPTPFEVWRGVSDASGGITASVLTDGTASWTPGKFVGFMLNPNLAQNATFVIIANTATTITVSGDMTGAAVSGNAYAVARCQFDTLTIGGTAYAGITDFGLGFPASAVIVGDGTNAAVLSLSGAHAFASLLVKSNSVVTHVATDVANVNLLDLTVSGNVDIESGGSINADGRGYLGGYQGGNNSTYGRTSGNVVTNGSSGGSGGSYGGLGGLGSGGIIGSTYGNSQNPTEPGGGGGSDSGGHHGGNGGGLIRMTVDGILTNNGVITASGVAPGYYVSGGGAGGGIRLDAGILTGSGSITANGSSGGTYSGIPTGGGGGGRIAIYYGTDTFSGVISSYGGTGHDGGGSGGAGTSNLQQAYLTISGRVTEGESRLSGVTMGGLPGNPLTDTSGYYTYAVTSGWSGTVTPSKAGYTFSPANRPYSNVTSNLTLQDYSATLNTYTISGTVTCGGAGLSNVKMKNLPGNPMTDAAGFYSATVDYGWSGVVTPIKAGYVFNPPSRSYPGITGNQTDQHYEATLITYLPPGLIAYYPFNGNADDESDNGNNGTVYGAALTPDRWGNLNSAYHFNGVSNYIEVPSPVNFPVGNAPRTISAWIKSVGETSGDLYQSIVGWGTPTYNNQVFAIERGGSPGGPYDNKLFVLGWNNDFSGSTNINFNTWYHVAATFDGTYLTVYVNGISDGSTTKTYNTVLNANGLRIGCMPPNDGWHMYFNGIIDDISIYDRALSATEIQSLSGRPVLSSAATTISGDQITLSFDKTMADPSGKQEQFKVTVNGTPVAITAIALNTDNTKIDLTLGSAIVFGESVRVSYLAGDVQSADGGLLASFSGSAVSNRVHLPGGIITNQDGLGFSGTIAANPLTDFNMTGYNSWPVGFVGGTDMFASGVFDGQSIWLVPITANMAVKVDKYTGNMTGYSAWPSGFAKTTDSFGGAVFDGQYVWLLPGIDCVKVDKDTGVMTNYNSWPDNFTPVAGAFCGGAFDGQYVWMVPFNADRVIKIDKDTGVMTGYNDWPAGFYPDSAAFRGAIFDGQNIWLIPHHADTLIKVDKDTGVMTGYNDWPAGFIFQGGLFSSGAYDGQNIWLIPCDTNMVVKFDTVTETMTGYNDWTAAGLSTDFDSSWDKFWGGAFDGQSIWMVPCVSPDRVVKIDKDTGVMTGYASWPAGLNRGEWSFQGGVFDGDSVWMVPIQADMVVKGSGNNMPTPLIWLKADAGIIMDSGNNISTWQDQSPNGKDATTLASNQEPQLVTNVLNGYPVVRFDGLENRFYVPKLADSLTQTTTIIVFRNEWCVDRRDMIATVQSPWLTDMDGIVNFINYNMYIGGHYTGAPVIPATLLSNTYNVVTITADASGTPVSHVYLNGALKSTAPYGTGIYEGQWTIGGRLVDYYGNCFKGDVAELLVFDGILSNSQKSEIESYLYDKYHIPIFNQDGIGFSGTVNNNPLSDFPMTDYSAWPSGFTKGTWGFGGGVFDGQNIWMMPYNADRVIKIDKDTGVMTGYSDWPAGFTKGIRGFSGGAFDGQNIWMAPQNADRVIKIDKDTGAMTGYSDWPAGFIKGTEAFVGAGFDGQNFWMSPVNADRVIKIDKDTGVMTGYNAWPSGFVLPATYSFVGGIFDGQNIWLTPLNADRVIKIDKDTGAMTGYNAWPSGFVKGTMAFAGGCFDGQNIWLVPFSADRVIKIDKDTGVMTGYIAWPAGFTKGANAFEGAIFDGQNIWMVARSSDRVIKIDKDTGAMTGYNAWPAGFAKGADAFIGGVFDGQSIWMIPFDADRVVKGGQSAALSHTISGTVSTPGGLFVSGVTIGGLPGSPITNANGYYSATVNDGWTGTATPSLAGYTFSPASISYTAPVTEDLANQNYTATQNAFTISGRVTLGASGLAGVTMNGLPGNPVTEDNGGYSASVPSGWSGTVIPTLAGYTFSPATGIYGNVTADYLNNDYAATQITYTVSGTVTEGATGLADVIMNGLPGSPVTTAGGFYTATVTYGWSGTVTPSKSGYSFTPASRLYTNVVANQTLQDYSAAVTPFTISGTVTSGGQGVSNVIMSGLPGNPATDASGFYTASVPSGWSGTVTPALVGYNFSPESRTYSSITTNQSENNYNATLSGGTYYVDSANSNSGNGTAADPWRLLHFAVSRINNGSLNTYVLHVAPGTYTLTTNDGLEPVQPLYITQSNLTIIGSGIGQTIIDGTGGAINGVDSSNGGALVNDLNSWDDAFDIQGATNVVIEDLEIKNFAANGIHLGSAVGCVIDACSIHSNARNGVNIEYGFGTPPVPSTGNKVQNGCAIFNNGFAGVYIYDGSGNMIMDNSGSIYDNGGIGNRESGSSGAGIFIYGANAANNIISNNRIYYSGDSVYVQGAGIAIDGSGTGNHIFGNVIFGHGNSAASTGVGIEVDGSDAVIEKNILYDNVTGIGVSDATGPAAPQIFNNLIYNGTASKMLWGILVASSGSGASPVIYHNTLDGGGNDGIYLDNTYGPVNAVIKFNIISNFSHWGIADITGTANPLIDYNDVYHNGVNYYLCSGSNDPGVEPGYVGGGDYHLQPGSVCINSIPYSLDPPDPVSDDLDGILRPQPQPDGDYDMGCYELPQSSTFTITAGAGAGGSISPSGEVSVSYGSDQTFTITPDPCYHVADVRVDGSSVGAVASYTFTNVTADHTISASFAIMNYTITAGADPGGSISPSGEVTAPCGSDQTFMITPDFYYFVADVRVDGISMGSVTSYTFNNVTADHTISASFAMTSFTITFTAGANGTVSPAGSQTVSHNGSSSAVTAIANTGYHFVNWTGTGGFASASNPLTISNPTSSMTLQANFAADYYTVTFTAGAGGSISGNGFQSIAYGGDCTPVKAVAASGYEFVGWTGGYTGTANPLTITNVTSNMAVYANFREQAVVTHTVTFTAGAGGALSGNPSQTISDGGDCTPVTAVSDTGYEFTGWTGDYTGTANPLTITHVTVNLSIHANFTQKTVTVNVSGPPPSEGSVAGVPTEPVPYGETITLTAVPKPGYQFTGWTGDYTGTANPLTLTDVTSDINIVAHFDEITGNLPPAAPVLDSPEDKAIVPPGPVEFKVSGYSDPEGDAHTSTWWQVGVKDGIGLLIDEKSDTDLMSYLMSTGFEPGIKYEWRAAYQDAGSGKYSSWPDKAEFIVGASQTDEDIPPVEPGAGFKDYRLVSFIQWPDDPSAPGVFGPLMPEGYDEKQYRIGTYDPTVGQGGYKEYPDFTVEPGRSYWILARDGLDLSVTGVPVAKSADFCVGLKFNSSNANGWNMIAVPNDSNYHWGDLQVVAKDRSGNVVFGPMAISQLAADNEYLDVRIWTWSGGSYTSSDDAGFLLTKYSGYWVRAKKANVSLCFPTAAQLAMSRAKTLIASWIQEVSAHVKDMIHGLGVAYAGISFDSPPSPMADFSGKAGGGSGCFISTIQNEE